MSRNFEHFMPYFFFHTFFLPKFCFLCRCFMKYLVEWQCRPWSDCFFRSSLIWACTVCICIFVRHFGVWNFKTFTVVKNNDIFFKGKKMETMLPLYPFCKMVYSAKFESGPLEKSFLPTGVCQITLEKSSNSIIPPVTSMNPTVSQVTYYGVPTCWC